jgi:hypothetical protein
MTKLMNYKWDRKKVEVLIELFRSEESLWNNANIDYSDADKRKGALRRIGDSRDKLGGIDGGPINIFPAPNVVLS